MTLDGAALRCPTGHSFDVAKHGYVSLLPGDAHTGTADTAAMVASREEFLESGSYQVIADAVAEAAPARPGCVLDLGAGTGYYLARVLDALPDQYGLALDLSKYAIRRAARAHPRVGAVVADAWQSLPVRDAVAGVVLSIFAPRNASEIARVLSPDGVLIMVTPTQRHLGELITTLDMLKVDQRKSQRLTEKLDPHVICTSEREVEFTMSLSHKAVSSVVAMGPSAWHDRRTERISNLPEPVSVTASVSVATYRPRG